MAEKSKNGLKTGAELITTQTELMQKNIGREIVERAVSGDQDAFEKLYRSTYRYVYAVAKYYLSDDEDIRDAIQETFTRVYRHISKLKDPDAFAWWLRTIAENCSKTIFSKNEKVEAELSDLEEKIISPEDPLKSNDVTLDITEVLLALKPADAELLTLVYYDKLKVSEIARMKELPNSTVRSRVKAAEKRLLKMLSVRGIDKPIYGGDFVAMVTTAFRNAIGTDLLSATVAQEILDNIRGKDEKRGAVIGEVARKERNKAVLRLAGIMVAVTIFFALLIFGIFKIAEAIEGVSTGTKGTESDESATIFETLFGGNSSQDTSSDETSSTDNTSSEAFNSTDGSSENSTLFTTNPATDTAGFAPDCETWEYNTLGRHNSNGYIATQGDWIYTSIGYVTNFNNNDGLWKVKKDGSGRVKLSNTSATQINVVGEYIYFIAPNGIITKMRTDGKGTTVLSDLYAENLVVVGKYAYFTSKGKKNNGTQRKYYKMDLGTLETEALIDDLYEKNIYWSSSDKVFIIDSAARTISRFYPETKKTELWYEKVNTGGLVSGRYFVSDKIYDLETKRSPISYVASNEEAIVLDAYYYRWGGVEKIYLSFYYYVGDSLEPSETKSGSLNLSDMSFSQQVFGFGVEYDAKAYSFSNIFDGYIYAFDDEGYFMRTSIEENDYKIYN